MKFGDRVAGWFRRTKLIENGTLSGQKKKLDEEYQELLDAIASGNEKEKQDAIGDMAVVVAGMAAMCGVDFEDACNHAWHQIKNRKGYVTTDGIFLKEGDIPAIDPYWKDKVKFESGG